MKSKSKLKPLTPKQKSILVYVLTKTVENGYQPSQREIADHFNVTPHVVAGQLRACEKKGYIQLSGFGRGIKFIKEI